MRSVVPTTAGMDNWTVADRRQMCFVVATSRRDNRTVAKWKSRTVVTRRGMCFWVFTVTIREMGRREMCIVMGTAVLVVLLRPSEAAEHGFAASKRDLGADVHYCGV